MITRLSNQAGRRYTQFRSSISIDAMPISQRGTSATAAFTVKFRKTLSSLGGKIGQRQAQGG